jgi:hypothetical protein
MAHDPGPLERTRWRLRGAWTWPVFAVVTVLDAVALYLLPVGSADPVLALVAAVFGNLVLIAAVAPWIGRRLAARERLAGRTTPASVFEDRAAVILQLAGLAGLVVAGIALFPLVIAETERTERIPPAVSGYVRAHGPPEVQRNLEAANKAPLDDRGNFRVCVPLDDRTRAWCVFVDATQDPARVRPDPDRRPNPVYFGEQ